KKFNSKLGTTWETFAPAGRLSFHAEIERLPNPPPDQPPDMDITVNVAGCAMEPKFFPYVLGDVAAQFRYRKSKVELTSFRARRRRSSGTGKCGCRAPSCGRASI